MSKRSAQANQVDYKAFYKRFSPRTNVKFPRTQPFYNRIIPVLSYHEGRQGAGGFPRSR